MNSYFLLYINNIKSINLKIFNIFYMIYQEQNNNQINSNTKDNINKDINNNKNININKINNNNQNNNNDNNNQNNNQLQNQIFTTLYTNEQPGSSFCCEERPKSNNNNIEFVVIFYPENKEIINKIHKANRKCYSNERRK